MRGHGAVITGHSLEDVVMGSVYLTQNARIRLSAAMLGDHVTELSKQECHAGEAIIGRPASQHRAWSHFAALVTPRQR